MRTVHRRLRARRRPGPRGGSGQRGGGLSVESEVEAAEWGGGADWGGAVGGRKWSGSWGRTGGAGRRWGGAGTSPLTDRCGALARSPALSLPFSLALSKFHSLSLSLSLSKSLRLLNSDSYSYSNSPTPACSLAPFLAPSFLCPQLSAPPPTYSTRRSLPPFPPTPHDCPQAGHLDCKSVQLMCV